MTVEREQRLRARIDALSDERDEARRLARDLATQRTRPVFGRCSLCGAPCYGRACVLHRDLLYGEEQPLRRTTWTAEESTTAATRSTLDESGAGGRKGGKGR